MPPPPITIHLSKFEHIEILRAEIERRQEEQRQTEKQIRDVGWEIERQRYLQSLHPVFRQMEPPAHAKDLPQLESNRDVLFEAVQVMQATLTQLEAETAGQAAPPPRSLSSLRGAPAGQPAATSAPAPVAAAPRRAKFEF